MTRINNQTTPGFADPSFEKEGSTPCATFAYIISFIY